ncbi:MAG: SDR family NAD(P)-dependent oxidoreductase [Desulfovibrio sp.]|nr:SDR family NAD(P)-dependent oxidoreductase [Desulfovibrio sp.]
MRSCITLPIAVIGVGCRLPGGVTKLGDLWTVLKEGRDCISRVPDERWNSRRFLHPLRTHAGTSVTFEAGLIDHIYDFDADFFGISPKEAESMDPQQRLLLELAWEAFEDANIPPSTLADSDTAVFVGAASPDSGTSHADDLCATTPYSMTGTNLSIIANRLSYIYNFHGPSFTLDTACSSSLYALFQACQTLASGCASMALACGVNVLLAPYPFVGFSQAYMLSPEGRCKVFDATGNGYVRAEGGAVLLLEPLSEALAQGHTIHAVIRACACNSDGKTQGIAMPSARAQEDLMRGVYEQAKCAPDSITYLEAHGTGTAVGDPIEAQAIGLALGQKRTTALPIGSVKCHLGHLETASAMAGILKSLVMFKTRQIPAQIHITRLNPDIDFSGLNLRVPLAQERFPESSVARIGVNSFGFGGANGHVLLEEPPKAEAVKSHFLPHIFLSAKNQTALRSMAAEVADFVAKEPETSGALGRQQALARELLPYRLAAFGQDPQSLCQALRDFSSGVAGSDCLEAQAQAKGRTAFVFTGNGCHWLGMGQDLLAHPVFLAKVQEVSRLFAELASVDLLDLLKNADADALEKTEITQPLIFLIQVGLCALLEDQGIVPDVVFGHSVGEVCAVWASGILSLRDAVRVVYFRSVCQGKTRGLGKMAAAKISPEEFLELSKSLETDSVEIAGVNAQGSLTLCGSEEGLLAIGKVLQKKRVFFRMLPLDYAFHSSAMEGIRSELLQSLEGIKPLPAKIPFISSVAGISEGSNDFGPWYWWQNIRKPVMFYVASCQAIHQGVRYFLEIGPHAILQQYLRSALKACGVQGWVGSCMQKQGDNLRLVSSLARNAWTHGWPLDLARYFGDVDTFKGQAFSYPWQRTYLRIPETPESQGYLLRKPVHPLLGWQTRDTGIFQNVLDLASYPWLADHKVGETVFYPAAAYLEMAFAAAFAVHDGALPLVMENTAIFRPVLLEGEHGMSLRSRLETLDGEFRIEGRPFMQDTPWQLYSRGRIHTSSIKPPQPHVLLNEPEQFGRPIARETLYALTQKANMHYGPIFSQIEQAWQNGPQVLARFAQGTDSAEQVASEENMLIAPPLLDGGLQLLFLLIADQLEKSPAPRLPYWFDRCVLYAKGRPAYALLTLVASHERSVCCDIDYYTADGQILLAMRGGRARLVERLAKRAGSSRFATELVAKSCALSPDKLEPERFWQALEQGLRQLQASEAWKKTTLVDGPLMQAALQRLVQDYQQLPHKPELSVQLSHYLDLLPKAQLDLPPFPELISTLFFDAPKDNAAHLLLLAAHARLIEGHTLSTGDLWQQYYASTFGEITTLLLEALPAYTEKNLAPLTLVVLGASFSDLPAKLTESAVGHELWFTDFSQTNRSQSVLWSEQAEHCNYAQWQPDRTVSPAPKAHLLFAVNCLHKAEDLLLALGHCLESLLPGGSLCLVEREPNLFSDVLEGLEPDWWTEAPESQSFTSPLMTRQAWQKALEQAGFCDVQSLACETNDGCFVLQGRRPLEQEALQAPLPACALVLPDPSTLQAFATELRAQADVRLCDGELAVKLMTGERSAWQKFLADESLPSTCVLPLAGSALSYELAVSSAACLTGLAQAWQESAKPATRFLFVTFGAYQDCPALASALGAARVIANEVPNLEIFFLDLDSSPDQASLAACVERIFAKDLEREERISSGRRFVLRSHELVEPVSTSEPAVDEAIALKLAIGDPGHLESLHYEPVRRPQPGPDEVLVRVKATGLNFRDVMWAMNLLPEEALENGFSGPGLGIECAGEIVGLGRQVKNLALGERVVAFGPNCFSSYVLTKASACAPIPEAWDYQQAATVPVTFFTAYYGFVHLAALQAGERVLIHGACGGVGLAAIQIAQSLGLEIFATAGSPLKRKFLRMLGIEHVYDSRTLAFRDDILRDTAGEGLDCVLNSLAGEAISCGLDLLKPFGRFLELGKSDFYADSALRLRPFRNNISYFGIDVDQLMRERPQLGQKLFGEMMQHFAQGEWRPLPNTVFAAKDVESAFRFMQKSQHIGKIVVTAPKTEIRPKARQSFLSVSAKASYLVTGGLSGFGLACARFLAEQGAGALLLLSRRGECDENHAMLEAMRAQGTRVIAQACDVRNEQDLAQALQSLPEGFPVKGVVHAAAVLEDGLVSKMQRAQLEKVLAPKVAGAFALHKVTAQSKLDFFLVFSSVTTLVGNPGQLNYVAANAAMESLCRYRRSLGLPALAVGWGAIADCGMLTRDQKTLASLSKLTGIVPQSARAALLDLARLPQDTAPVTYLFAADWRKLAALPIARQKRFSPLVDEFALSAQKGVSLLERLKGKSEEEAHELVLAEVTALIARILRTQVANVRATMPLQEMGIDSLMAVELSLALEELMDGHPLTGSISANVSAEELSARIVKALASGEEESYSLFSDLAQTHGLGVKEASQLEARVSEGQ